VNSDTILLLVRVHAQSAQWALTVPYLIMDILLVKKAFTIIKQVKPNAKDVLMVQSHPQTLHPVPLTMLAPKQCSLTSPLSYVSMAHIQILQLLAMNNKQIVSCAPQDIFAKMEKLLVHLLLMMKLVLLDSGVIFKVKV
jgi:hypothetical protein